MSEELKPCPFCGEKANVSIAGIQGNYYVICRGCQCTTDDGSKERAIALWNARPSSAGEKDGTGDGDIVGKLRDQARSFARNFGQLPCGEYHGCSGDPDCHEEHSCRKRDHD